MAKKKTTTKKIKKVKTKEIDIHDTDHPFRRTAIDIIRTAVEPLVERGLNGKVYYNLEDNITKIIYERLNSMINKPLKLDNSPSIEPDEDDDNEEDEDDYFDSDFEEDDDE